jgi:hypothetical protein
MILDIPDDWTPTPDNVNALPKPLRTYIHDLATMDPAYIVRENLILKYENNVLLRECERLAARLGLPTAPKPGQKRPLPLKKCRPPHASAQDCSGS